MAYVYHIIAGSRKHPRGWMATAKTKAAAKIIAWNYSLGHGCPRYIKREKT